MKYEHRSFPQLCQNQPCDCAECSLFRSADRISGGLKCLERAMKDIPSITEKIKGFPAIGQILQAMEDCAIRGKENREEIYQEASERLIRACWDIMDHSQRRGAFFKLVDVGEPFIQELPPEYRPGKAV